MTAAVAWIALSVSCVGVTWQIIAWVRSGPRVIVRSAEEVVFPLAAAKSPRLVVVVTNIGRQATTLHEVALSAGGVDLGPKVVSWHELPVRLEAGDEFVGRVWSEGLQDLFAYGYKPRDLTPLARVGHRWVQGRYKPEDHRVYIDSTHTQDDSDSGDAT